MQYFSNLIFVLLVIIIAVPATKAICDFFSIEPRVYISYMLWSIALLLFVTLLPSENKSDLMKFAPLVITAGVAVKKPDIPAVPKVVPTVATPATTNVAPKVAPKKVPNVAPKKVPNVATSGAPKVAPPATPKVAPPATPKVAPKKVPNVATSGATSGATSDIIINAVPPITLKNADVNKDLDTLKLAAAEKQAEQALAEQALAEQAEQALAEQAEKAEKLETAKKLAAKQLLENANKLAALKQKHAEEAAEEEAKKKQRQKEVDDQLADIAAAEKEEAEQQKQAAEKQAKLAALKQTGLAALKQTGLAALKQPEQQNASNQSGGKWNILLDFDGTIAEGHSNGINYIKVDGEVKQNIMGKENIKAFKYELNKWFDAGHKVAIISRGITSVDSKYNEPNKKTDPSNNLIDYLKLILKGADIDIIGYYFYYNGRNDTDIKLIDVNDAKNSNQRRLYVVGPDASTYYANNTKEKGIWWADQKKFMVRKIIHTLHTVGTPWDNHGIYKSVFADDTKENFEAMAKYDFFGEAKMPCFWAAFGKYADTFKNVNNIIEGKPIDTPLERTQQTYKSDYITRNYPTPPPDNK